VRFEASYEGGRVVSQGGGKCGLRREERFGDWVGVITLGAMMGRSESSDRRGMVEALTL
jgi:hypothetical protein